MFDIDALEDARIDAARDAFHDWCDARGYSYDDPDAEAHYAGNV